MTARPLGQAPELTYEPSAMNAALLECDWPELLADFDPQGVVPLSGTATLSRTMTPYNDLMFGWQGDRPDHAEKRRNVLRIVKDAQHNRQAQPPIARPSMPKLRGWLPDPSPHPVTSGQRIREFRERAGTTRWVLARRVGVTYSTVSAWELGHVQPTRANLVALADALDVSPAVLGA